ncbi:hypothetical protein J8281_03610 [Aquimarina sp. U1-2]|uniref:hypothetical protein n=1 Tax=Aquimarina sp. U1-2 TaxID=2823141 RepID=UPI001AECBE1D|nr:hypothetical protein [Aquimarina sp. U1-2]MBP2831265.1 hypothetical protein [Aquimarina sp. U1-2]
MKKRLYAIYDQHGNFRFKKEFDTKGQLTRYLNERYEKGQKYYGIELTGSTVKLSEANIKKLEASIEKAKEYLYPQDIASLKKLVKVLKSQPAREGMVLASSLDTIVRDVIPLEVWKAIGGKYPNPNQNKSNGDQKCIF